MPLQPPDLDTRTFEQLLAQARQRIPRYTPDWTDFNDSDPGMALVQLFAWFTELMLYQMNQVPERNYVKFLQLLNLELKPARPARAYVVFTMKNGASIQTVPARAIFDVAPASGSDQLFFESTAAVDLVPYNLDSVQVFDGAEYTDFSAANQDGTQPFRPLGWAPQPGSALYLGFKPPEGNLPARPTFPARITLRVFLPTNAAQVARADAQTLKPARPPQTLVWEYRSNLDLARGQSPDTIDRWRQLATLTDDSAALTQEGNVIVRGPGPDILATLEGKLTDEKQRRYWLRLRLADGAYPADKVPEIALVRGNVVEVENLLTVTEEELGESDGRQHTYALRHTPVDKGSLRLETDVPGNDQPDVWREVDDFLSSGSNDPVYTLNFTSGVITFGDGSRGRIPEPGATIVARSYRAGGGSAGNVGVGAIASPPGAVADVDAVTNPRPAIGGTDEESLDDLKARAPRALRGDGRAVTTDDFARFAGAVPGVAKAEALAGRHPDYPGFPVPGAVTVVVVPEGDEAGPLPSGALTDLVHRRLDEVRLLTTELFVVGPRYRGVGVNAKVLPGPQASQQQVKDALEQAVRDFLRPTQWSFGDTFYPSAFYKVLLSAQDPILKAPYIRAVVQLDVTLGGQPRGAGDNTKLDDDELPSCASVVVTALDPENS